MRVHVKILKGAECTVNISEQDSVLRLKELVQDQLEVPVSCQRIVHRGKPLSDAWTLKQSGVRDGTKLFLAIKKEDSTTGSAAEGSTCLSLWDELHYFLLKHYRQTDAKLIMEEFKKNFQKSIDSLSLDDINTIAASNLHKLESR